MQTSVMPQWKDYRRRRISFFVAWLGGFGLFGFACMVADFWRNAALTIILPVLAAWIISFVVTLGWLRAFRCPRCGGTFLPPFIGVREPHKFLYAPQCVHCGLSAYGALKA
jgi:uncharacterized SAM-binding protein YcdF (DUF218 family)